MNCTRERFIICTNRDCAPSFLSQKNYSQLFDLFDYLILIFQDRTSQTIALFLPIFDSIQRTTESFPRYFKILHPRILGINSPIIAKSRGKVYPLDIDGYFDRGFVKMAKSQERKNCTFRFVSTLLSFLKIVIFDQRGIDRSMFKKFGSSKIFRLFNVRI